MKSGVANLTKLNALLKKLGTHEPIPAAGNPDAAYDDPIAVLVYSFMLWDATTEQANDAMQKLVESIVDFNELRVCLPTEVVALIGSRYPNGLERAERMKSALHSIYLQRHAVSLEHLSELGKRETKAFVESLTDIPAYVSARVLQRCYDVHAIPVDDRLVDLFVEKGVLSEPVESDEVVAWLSRQVKSKDGSAVEAALRVFVDTSPKPQRKSVAKKPATKKTEPKEEVVAEAEPKKESKKKAAEDKGATKTAKVASKKAPAKKPVAKKAATKKPAAKKAATKKPAAKKAATKKPAKKAAKKAPAKKASKKTAKKAASKKKPARK